MLTCSAIELAVFRRARSISSFPCFLACKLHGLFCLAFILPDEFPGLLAVSVLSVDELRSVLDVSGLLFGLSSVKVPSKSRVEVSSGDNSSLYPSTVESPSNSKLSSPRSSSLS